jgi:hypothetical protein
MLSTAHSLDQTTPIPRLKIKPTKTPPDHPADFSAPWRMQQAWLEREEENFRAGSVSLAWQPDALWVFALLPDDAIFSASTADGQELWTLGDVFEIFLRRADSEEYLELHVSPNGHQLHLRWPAGGLEQVRNQKATLADFMADPRAFSAEVIKLPKAEGWTVLAKIPTSIVPGEEATFTHGQELVTSFSRYDGNHNGQNPILSSTSPHQELSFHRQQEWRGLTLMG